MGSPIVAAYMQLWGDDWNDIFRKNIPLTNLTRLIIAFGNIIQDSNKKFTIDVGQPERLRELVARVKYVNPTAEIFLTVAGNGDGNSYGGASADKDFPKRVYEVLKNYQLDGFDVDWEDTLYRNNLSNLMTGLSKELHSNGCKLTMVGWSECNIAYDAKVLSAVVDQINLMTYGPGQELDWSVETYTQQGFSSNQLIGGVTTIIGCETGVDTLGPDGTIAKKAAYALKNLAGMMSWELGADYMEKRNFNIPTYRGAEQLWESMQTRIDPYISRISPLGSNIWIKS